MAQQEVDAMLTLMGFRCKSCYGVGSYVAEGTDGWGHPCEYEMPCKECDGEGYLCES